MMFWPYKLQIAINYIKKPFTPFSECTFSIFESYPHSSKEQILCCMIIIYIVIASTLYLLSLIYRDWLNWLDRQPHQNARAHSVVQPLHHCITDSTITTTYEQCWYERFLVFVLWPVLPNKVACYQNKFVCECQNAGKSIQGHQVGTISQGRTGTIIQARNFHPRPPGSHKPPNR